jgi:hypothetical protein
MASIRIRNLNSRINSVASRLLYDDIAVKLAFWRSIQQGSFSTTVGLSISICECYLACDLADYYPFFFLQLFRGILA